MNIYEILNFFGSQTKHYKRWWRNWQLFVDVEYSWGISLHDVDMKEFLRIKTVSPRVLGFDDKKPRLLVTNG